MNQGASHSELLHKLLPSIRFTWFHSLFTTLSLSLTLSLSPYFVSVLFQSFYLSVFSFYLSLFILSLVSLSLHVNVSLSSSHSPFTSLSLFRSLIALFIFHPVWYFPFCIYLYLFYSLSVLSLLLLLVSLSLSLSLLLYLSLTLPLSFSFSLSLSSPFSLHPTLCLSLLYYYSPFF